MQFGLRYDPNFLYGFGMVHFLSVEIWLVDTRDTEISTRLAGLGWQVLSMYVNAVCLQIGSKASSHVNKMHSTY